VRARHHVAAACALAVGRHVDVVLALVAGVVLDHRDHAHMIGRRAVGSIERDRKAARVVDRPDGVIERRVRGIAAARLRVLAILGHRPHFGLGQLHGDGVLVLVLLRLDLHVHAEQLPHLLHVHLWIAGGALDDAHDHGGVGLRRHRRLVPHRNAFAVRHGLNSLTLVASLPHQDPQRRAPHRQRRGAPQGAQRHEDAGAEHDGEA
jgi:hypothetical protein